MAVAVPFLSEIRQTDETDDFGEDNCFENFSGFYGEMTTSFVQEMDAEMNTAPAGLDSKSAVRSCTTCSKAKAKCVKRPDQSICERQDDFHRTYRCCKALTFHQMCSTQQRMSLARAGHAASENRQSNVSYDHPFCGASERYRVTRRDRMSCSQSGSSPTSRRLLVGRRLSPVFKHGLVVVDGGCVETSMISRLVFVTVLPTWSRSFWIEQKALGSC